jgi:ABC-type transport system involved in multi-copper enzyme maturation permease subunit
MGLNPIEYSPWTGTRSEHAQRYLVIAERVLRDKMRGWTIALIVLGIVLIDLLNLIVMIMMPHEVLTSESMLSRFGGTLFFVFTIILVSLVCGDLLAEDLRSSSITLYLSRALRPAGYLLGKSAGALMVMLMFTLLPAVMVGVAVMATQSGSDYLASLEVIGQTIAAGLWTAVFLLPLGLMMSSLTGRKTYAAVGTFMAAFVLEIIGSIFTEFDPNWHLISPFGVMYNSCLAIFGQDLSPGIDPVLLAVMAFVFTVPPALIAYYRIYRKGVGK